MNTNDLVQFRPGRWFGRGLMAALSGATLLSFTTQIAAVERQALPGHVPPTVAKLNLQPTGRLPASTRLNLAIGLPLRNQAALTNLLGQVYDPASPQFRHYLTAEQFAERFGPNERDYELLSDFVRRNGFEVVGRHPNRVLLDVAAKVSDIERTFQVRLHTYQHPREGRQFFAPDREPSLGLDVPVLHISGLENYAPSHSLAKFTPFGPAFRTGPASGSAPWGQYIAKDLRTAYAPDVALTGAGQKVGLLEFDGYYPRDIEGYENLAGLPSVTLSNVLLNGFNGVPGGQTVEVSLDIEMAVAMAPGLSEVIVYEGVNPDDVLNRMATDNLAKQLSSSWGWSPFSPIANQIFQQMALQGQSMLQASADDNAWAGAVGPLADDPYLTLVGGTTMTMTGNGGAYSSETVWNAGVQGSSGGVSLQYPIPAWQQGIDMSANGGSTTMRNAPDVAALADAIFTFDNNGQMGYTSETSCAAPLWAGFTALVNQAALANGQPVVGFLNPALYAIGKSAAYTNNFHDITTGNNENYLSPTKYRAVPGYDLCTGWGSPKGSNLVYSLAMPEPLRLTPAGGAILAGPVGGPFALAGQPLSLANGGSSPLAWALAADAPWLTLPQTIGILAAGDPATSISPQPNQLANWLAAGTYHATLYCTNLSDQAVQILQITLAIVDSPVITSPPTNLAVFAGMNASFSVGTASNGLVYYQWQRGDATNPAAMTDGGNVSGSATSTLTIGNVSPEDAGAYSVIVSNAAGSVTSAAALLDIVPSGPVIVSDPADQALLPGAGATFTVRAAGDQPLSYHWLMNGTNLSDGGGISGSATSTLTLANVGAANAGTYSVMVVNARGSASSAGARLSVTPVTAPAVSLETVYSFTGTAVGAYPYAGLVQTADGDFYGTTSQGGARGMGTIFRVAATGAVTLVHYFINGNEGAFPYGALVQGTNGLLYGATSAGGTDNGFGTTFRVNTNGAVSSFSFDPTTTGDFAMGGLVQGRDGNFYGTTFQGGNSGYGAGLGLTPNSGYGAVFKLTAGGVLTGVQSFDYLDGANPSSVLLQAADGGFYGTTRSGGTNGGWGTVFKLTPAGGLTALFSFGNTNGAGPAAGLVQDTDGAFYGTTYSGGTKGFGTVFKLATDGTVTSLYSFSGGSDGRDPYGGLVLALDGNLYGTTENGGAYGSGTVFRVSTTGTLTTLVQFDGYQGANPEGTLVQGTDGFIYGTTYNGGLGGAGTVFRFSLSGPPQITRQPQAQIAAFGQPVTFSVASSGSLSMAYQWLKNGTNLADGGEVTGSNSRTLTLSDVSLADAAIYSVEVSNSLGSVTSDGAPLRLLVSPPLILSGPQDQTVLSGSTVKMSVDVAGDGPLFFQWQENGTNVVDGGGVSGSATPTLTLTSISAARAGVFSIIVSNALDAVSSRGAQLSVVPAVAAGVALQKVYSFAASGGSGPFNSFASVIQGEDGYLYGTTLYGGENGMGRMGTVFKLGTAGGFTVLHSFAGPDLGGSNSYAGLIQTADGSLYGLASGNGADFGGTAFRISRTGAFSLLYTFTSGADGYGPAASLVQTADGSFLGTTEFGPQSATNFTDLGFGTAFKLETNGTLTTLAQFNSSNGSYPVAPLLEGPDHYFYGTTAAGGSNGFGTIFALTINGALTTVVAFDYTHGAYPSNGLVQASDGAFYGTASQGGTNGGWGAVFRLTADGALTALHSFNYADGAYPAGGLLQGTDGNLYGTTSQGGVGGQGTVFQITTNGQLTTLVWFNGPNGAGPQSSLIQARDGSFYGTTEFGGTDYDGASGTGAGLVFRLTLPMFLSNPFTQAVATVGQPYASTLTTNAVGPFGDALTFAKVSGPAWLNVAADGTLSGAPAQADIGANVFVVSLADTDGWSSTAMMRITVGPAPLLAWLSSSRGTGLILSWTGGQPPYQVQRANDLVNPVWQDLGTPTTGSNLLLTSSNAAAFYRIQEQ